MSFEPVVPLGGVAGWRFLERTEAAQRAAFDRSPILDRDIRYFEENIGTITTADGLVADRRLLAVALGAFGLDEEIDKKAFLQQILAGGTDDPRSLANRFVDPRYRAFSEAFGFGNILGAETQRPGFAREITDAFRTRQFEIAVGAADPNMRLALGFKREIAAYATAGDADSSAWFRVMGSVPMRTVFEAAFNLPGEFGTLDVDQQRDVLRDRTRDLFGDDSLAVFSDPANVDRLIDRFLVRQQISTGPTISSPALTLLQAGGDGGFGAAARINLILSSS